LPREDVLTESLSLYDRMFYDALRIRLVEERIVDLYPSDRIQSPVHLSIGEEAVAVGVCQPLREEDLLFASYRSHSYYLAKGGDLKEMFAELYGKATGVCGGKAGSMHLAAPEAGLMGSSAVVASTISHAVGAALAAGRLGKDQLTVAVFGDGATEQGVFHESLNFAALHRLPVVFVCENNQLAVHADLASRQAYRISDMPKVYGIQSVRMERGYDLTEVREAMAESVNSIRETGGPRFLEVVTYRYKEHVGPGEDHDAGYRSQGDLDRWQAHDPLITDGERVARFTPEITAEIDAAAAFAEDSPWPGSDALLSDVV